MSFRTQVPKLFGIFTPKVTVDEALLKLAGFLKAVFAAWFLTARRISGTVPLPVSTAITDWSSLFSTRTPGKEVTPRLARAACFFTVFSLHQNFSPTDTVTCWLATSCATAILSTTRPPFLLQVDKIT